MSQVVPEPRAPPAPREDPDVWEPPPPPRAPAAASAPARRVRRAGVVMRFQLASAAVVSICLTRVSCAARSGSRMRSCRAGLVSAARPATPRKQTVLRVDALPARRAEKATQTQAHELRRSTKRRSQAQRTALPVLHGCVSRSGALQCSALTTRAFRLRTLLPTIVRRGCRPTAAAAPAAAARVLALQRADAPRRAQSCRATRHAATGATCPIRSSRPPLSATCWTRHRA